MSEALKLADAIANGWLENVDPDKADINMIQTELRTQAARIAELEAERGTAGYARKIESLIAERDTLRAEVERLRTPLTAQQAIAIKRATKAADPTQQWGDTLAFTRAIEAAKEAK